MGREIGAPIELSVDDDANVSGLARLMEIAPDLQFKHYPTRSRKHLPFEQALVHVAGVRSARSRSAATMSTGVFYAEHTDPQVAEALRGTLVPAEAEEWASTGPGAAA